MPRVAPVRCQSAFAKHAYGSSYNCVIKKSRPITSSSVRFQSALVRRVTQNRNQHFPCCGHSILTDRMAVKLERQLHIAVTKQGLYSFWIGSHADQKRCQTVAKVVEAEPAGIIVHESAVFVSMR